MEVRVDSEKCQGHARCHAICPDVFELDDEGFAAVPVPTVPPSFEHAVREAVMNCPEGAIATSGDVTA